MADAAAHRAGRRSSNGINLGTGAAARRNGPGWTIGHIQHQLVEWGLGTLADELLANPGGSGRHLLIVVDQFEELLTQTCSDKRTRFAELLSPALSGSVQVVAAAHSA
jgi:hypothetical protein